MCRRCALCVRVLDFVLRLCSGVLVFFVFFVADFVLDACSGVLKVCSGVL